jgi:5-methylcytosine-specific restriction endonuclease McrA
MDDGSFHTFSFSEWSDFSANQNPAECVRTIRAKIHIPKVIMLLLYDRQTRKEVKFTRHNIFERDRDTCQYCGKVFNRIDLNLDHVIPRDQGGPMTWENIVCSCVSCNTHKANRTPLEAGMKLIRKPKRPKWRPFVLIKLGSTYHDDWRHFIDVAYWNVELGEEIG